MEGRIIVASILLGCSAQAQNDLDAIRLSRSGIGGSARFMGMSGAFGAAGGDVSCAAYNPGGLGLLRRGDMSFSGGLKFTNNEAILYNKTSRVLDAAFTFNNFGMASSWNSQRDPDSRHVVGFSSSQVQNFFNSVRMSAYTNSLSIAKDMLNLANERISYSNLNPGYEKMGYDTYLLEYDTVQEKYFSFVDLKRSVLQTRELVTSGKVNDINLSYAYSYKDKYYIGASLGIPQVRYQSSTFHMEADDKDSMRVNITSDTTFTTTYIDNLPYVYGDKLGFNDLSYTEYFKTTGSGINLKLGFVVRANEMLRLGMYYHTPTLYRLNDEYYNDMVVSFDAAKENPEQQTYPAEGGIYKYRIITPSRLGLNTAFIIKKLAVVAIDYELVNYRNARLASDNISDFAQANDDISQKYTFGHNIRSGVEINFDPLLVRLGYAMQGSPFGHLFTGEFIKHSYSAGVGFRPGNNLYFDLAWVKTQSTESYYLFNTMVSKSTLKYHATQLVATVGVRF